MSYCFWRKWKKFAKFQFENNPRVPSLFGKRYDSSDDDDYYKWLECSQFTTFWNLDKHQFGIVIDKSSESKVSKKSRQLIQSNWTKILDELSEIQSQKIFNELRCPICLKLVDMTANLEWLNWKHIFCFYWLIKSLESKSSCPYCKSAITIDKLGTNSNLISTFNLMVEVEKSKRIPWEQHMQRWDIFWKLWKFNLWYLWILSDQHKSHELVSIESLQKETKDLWNELAKPENSIIPLIEKNFQHISSNRSIFGTIIKKWIEPYKSFIEIHSQEYNKITDEIHLPYINRLTQNIKNAKDNKKMIDSFAKKDLVHNLNKTLKSIEAQSQIKEDTLLASEQYKQSCSDGDFALVNPPISISFEIDMSTFKENNSIKAKPKLEETKYVSIELIKIESTDWGVQITKIDQANPDWFMKINFISQDFYQVKEQNCIEILDAHFKENYVNKLNLKEDKINLNDKIEIEVSLWELTEELDSYFKSRKELIKNGIQNLLDSL